ncbi:gluconolaconase [Reichenbachiella sp. MALMAid0571]|uniref:gluconolaconase n=1 Tax=Reichenbachiella sp. MALMAid0571 TaxID=3143939 RepID=UPI0032DF1BD6
MKPLSYLVLLTLCTLIIGCKTEKKDSNKEETSSTKETIEKKSLTKIWETDTLLTTCESVFYDKSNDVLYVSNIGGVPPDAQDNDGFISKVSTSGEILELRWVENIDAPKGMGMVGSNLYVTNIDELVAIDTKSGSITDRIPVDGSVFLNDITTSNDGTVYLSDSRGNKIFTYKDNLMSTWMEQDDFGGPNGLLSQGGKMMVAAFGSGNFMSIDIASKAIDITSTGLKGGDGLVPVGNDYMVSNWNGEVYFVKADGSKSKLLDTKTEKLNSADIEFIAAKNLLLVPTFFGNTVAAYELK